MFQIVYGTQQSAVKEFIKMRVWEFRAGIKIFQWVAGPHYHLQSTTSSNGIETIESKTAHLWKPRQPSFP